MGRDGREGWERIITVASQKWILGGCDSRLLVFAHDMRVTACCCFVRALSGSYSE
ncbi:hypothetical protein GCM10022212_26750 [Actimicrobium antarcticum]|uniref:Uncharacterized protein n=1 Tax=Actimicrobium antarcticum TaxID=1051899 RepID=A0ABP7TK21_9BURK